MLYLEEYNINSDSLFLTKYGKRITKNTISRFLLDIKEKLNIDQSISPHKWRHTCATLSIENGGTIEQVQKLLGHIDINTTKIYVHVKNETVKSMINKSSPLNNINKIDF